jgi:hypothetical protein
MDDSLQVPRGPFRINRMIRERFNYRRDTAWTGQYLTRLPDRSLVRLDDHEEALKRFTERQATPEKPGS